MNIVMLLAAAILGYFVYFTFDLHGKDWVLTIPLVFVAGLLALIFAGINGNLTVAAISMGVIFGQMIRVVRNSLL